MSKLITVPGLLFVSIICLTLSSSANGNIKLAKLSKNELLALEKKAHSGDSKAAHMLAIHYMNKSDRVDREQKASDWFYQATQGYDNKDAMVEYYTVLKNRQFPLPSHEEFQEKELKFGNRVMKMRGKSRTTLSSELLKKAGILGHPEAVLFSCKVSIDKRFPRSERIDYLAICKQAHIDKSIDLRLKPISQKIHNYYRSGAKLLSVQEKAQFEIAFKRIRKMQQRLLDPFFDVYVTNAETEKYKISHDFLNQEIAKLEKRYREYNPGKTPKPYSLSIIKSDIQDIGVITVYSESSDITPRNLYYYFFGNFNQKPTMIMCVNQDLNNDNLKFSDGVCGYQIEKHYGKLLR